MSRIQGLYEATCLISCK